ncbi:MAG: hypothetical protein DDT26_00235 [Dehalococcoidia bacterium]|nr:hypothetical protein [Chloroflexota bacterium]
MSNCFLCGIRPGIHPRADHVGGYFTDQYLARAPHSDTICDYCHWALKIRCWYFNPNGNKYVKLFGRGWSSLFVNNQLIHPVIEGEYTEEGTTLPVVRDLPRRAEIRGWLLDPPEPPFIIAIAESGQKHILPWAQTGHDRDYFPVQFELDCIWLKRQEFTTLLARFETLRGLGFTKTELVSGNYRSETLLQAIRDHPHWVEHDHALAAVRGSRLLDLVAHVALQPPEDMHTP